MRFSLYISLLLISLQGIAEEQLSRDPFIDRYWELKENSSELNLFAYRLTPFRIITVGGIYAGGNLFREQREWFTQNHIDWVRAATETEGSISQNIPILLQTIQNSPKPVILLTHSRGGSDVLFTLLDHPEIWGKSGVLQAGKVYYWLAISPAFFGTIGAEIAYHFPPFRKKFIETLKKSGGDDDALDSFTITGARNRFLSREWDLNKLLEAPYPKVLIFRSWIPKSRPYNWFRLIDVMKKSIWERRINFGQIFDQPIDFNQILSSFGQDIPYQKLKTDGFVFFYSSSLPGFTKASMEGIDHWDLSSDPPIDRPPWLSPAPFTATLLEVLLNGTK